VRLAKELFEVLRSAFGAFALLAFSDVLELTILKHGLHDYFSTARAGEFLCCNGSTRVFTGSSHDYPPSINDIKR
jgi:hypothetical protein